MTLASAFIRRLFQPSMAIGVIALLGAMMLMTAYGFEYIGGLLPCRMCYWQRIPHAVVIALPVLLMIFGRRHASLLAFGAGCIMLVSAGLGFWHSGVEWGFLPGPTGCSGNIDFSGDVSAVLDGLLSAKTIRCDEVPWSFLGLSMAGWNFVISALMAFYALVSATRPETE
jgi:disulfide bond formation protein DsbB